MRSGVAAASDADRGLVVFVDLAQHRQRGMVRLPPGSQPTRSVEDGAGNLQVILRGTGEVATLSPTKLDVVSIEKVCAEPRGITWDAAQQRTLIACATGDLISRPLTGPSSATKPGGELRDVMAGSSGVVVSTFRAPTLSRVSATGTARLLGTPPRIPFGVYSEKNVSFVPGTAWKTLALLNGGFAMVHQRAVDGDVRATAALAGPEVVTDTTTTFVPRVVGQAYYGGDIVVMDPVNHSVERTVCTTGVVRSAVTVFSADGRVRGSQELLGILPIDAALSASGLQLAVVSAGNHQLTRVNVENVTTVEGRACGVVQPSIPDVSKDVIGQATGVAYIGSSNGLVVHSRQPPRLVVLGQDDVVQEVYELPSTGPALTPGHTLFHTATRAVACASCHPEGGDDGHVWTFPGEVRRTQPLTGGISGTAPFHWSGNRSDMGAIMIDTFVNRMGGSYQESSVVSDLTVFLDGLPSSASPHVASRERVEQGKVAFSAARCDSCHGGPLLTRNGTVDVGTGGAFQVPSLLGLGARAPYMHDGCAATMRERFTKPGCGGSKHGDVSMLSTDDFDALVDYLQAL